MKKLAKKQAIGALIVFGFLTAAVPSLAQAALLGDAKQAATNAFSFSTAGPGETTLSGADALWIDDLETQLSLSPLTLGDDAWEGSAFQTTLNVTAGSVASFDWLLATDAFDSGFADSAFVVIDQKIKMLVTVGNTSLYGSFSYLFKTGGQHTFAVGVVDVNDVAGVSRLEISNVALPVSAVPEPSSLALMLAGLVGVGAAARKRRV